MITGNPNNNDRKAYLRGNFNSILKITSILMPVIFILCSCVSNFDENETFFSVSGDGSAAEEFVVIVSDYASAELVDRALQLSRDVSEITSVPCRVLRDGEFYLPKDGTVEVLLGNTSRSASREALYGMRAEDYICKTVDGCVVIGGKRDSVTVKAIDRFCREILPVSTACALIPENGGFSHFDSYKINSLKLNGLLMGEYDIVVSDRRNYALMDIAEAMQTCVADITGYWLDIREHDGEPLRAGSIYLGDISKEHEADTAHISVKEATFTFCAVGVDGIGECAEYFSNYLRNNAVGGDILCQLTDTVSLAVSGDTCSVVSAMIQGHLPVASPFAAATLASLVGSRTDVALLGTLEDGDESRIYENLEDSQRSTARCGEKNLYAYSRTECEYLCAEETDGLLVETLHVDKGDTDFLLIRISGRADRDVEIDISEDFGDSELPVIAMIHTRGEGNVAVYRAGRSLREVYRGESDDGDIYFSCYAETDRLSVSFVEARRNMEFCEIKVEHVR